jgi:hypothetical protein
MAVKIYTGGADDVPDVFTLTPGGTIEAGDLFLVTIGNATVSVAATATTVAQTCLDILAALQADGVPAEIGEITWEVDDDVTPTHVQGTGPSDGKPVYDGLAVSTTESNGGAADAQTFTKANTTPGTGSKFWSNVDNWKDGSVPVNGDEVFIGLYGIVPQYDIDQNAVTLDELHIMAGATSGLELGLPLNNDSGYVEYLNRYLKISSTVVYYGEGNGNETSKVWLNTGTNAATIQVYKSNPRDNAGEAPFQWIGNHASNSVNDCRGALDVGTQPDDAGQVSTLTYGASGDVRVGSGVTVTTLTANAGSGWVKHGTPPVTITVRNQAALRVDGTGGTTTTLTQEIGSKVDWRTTATVTDYVSSGSIDFALDDRGSKTFTNVDLYKGAVWNDPNKVITTTNGIDLNQCGVEDVTINLGKNRRLTLGTPA